MITFDYDTDYDPPMPVVSATVIHPDSDNLTANCIALVDSGADGTMFPLDLLEAIDAPIVGDARLRGVLGAGETVDVHLIRLQIGPYDLGGVRAVAMPEGSKPVLGRNVLNQFVITLNGLASVVEVEM